MSNSLNNIAVGEDGSIKYLPLSQEYLPKTINLINEIFFKEEHISTMLGLNESLKDINELSEKYIMRMINHEISFIAVEKTTKDVIGCQINVVAVESKDKSSFYSCFDDVKNPIAKAYVDINIQLDKAAHPFQLLQTNCYIEPTIAVVIPKFRKSGVLKMLCNMTCNMAIRFCKGENVRVPLNGKPSSVLPLVPFPTGIIVYSTLDATRKAVEKLEFKHIYEFDFKNVLKVDVLFKKISV